MRGVASEEAMIINIMDGSPGSVECQARESVGDCYKTRAGRLHDRARVLAADSAHGRAQLMVALASAYSRAAYARAPTNAIAAAALAMVSASASATAAAMAETWCTKNDRVALRLRP